MTAHTWWRPTLLTGCALLSTGAVARMAGFQTAGCAAIAAGCVLFAAGLIASIR